MKQYCLSKKHYIFIFILVLIIHLLLLLALFVAPPQLNMRPEVTISFDNDTYHADRLLSAGQEKSTTVFEHEQPETAPSEQLQNDTEQEATDAPAERPTMQLEKFASSLIIKEKKHLTTRTSGTSTTHKTRRTSNLQGPTLADISRGFLKSVKQHAGHNKAAHNPKELALQIYASKVWNSIKEAFLVGQNHLRLPASVSVQAQLNLTIDRSGKLVDIKLIYPQHVTELKPLEQLIIARAQEVGLFAPFGPQMTGQTQRFSFPLVIEGQEGFHSYSLGYR